MIPPTDLIQIDPFTITGNGLQDRLEDDSRADARLLASIRDHGQQVPVLVRPHPDRPGQYDIIYGRRRVLALRDLGRPVLALIRPLDPADGALARGAENALRRDLSYMEKANLTRQLIDRSLPRATIARALGLDLTEVARMNQLVRRLPPALVTSFGAASGVGFLRWRSLADLIAQTGVDPHEVCAIANTSDLNTSATGRFRAALAYVTTLKARSVPPRPARLRLIRAHDGMPFARVRMTKATLHLGISRRNAPGFDEYLLAQLPALLAAFRAAPTGTEPGTEMVN